MYGPKQNGFWSKRSGAERKPLELGVEYEVTKAFVDHDGTTHPVGERWRFVGSSFLPYDNGLSLFVQTPEGEWNLPFALGSDQEGPIWHAFEDYVRALPNSP
jgi:hypothetical protein